MAELASGLLKRLNKESFVLRTAQRSYRPGAGEVMVRPQLVHQYRLMEGAAVTGQVEKKRGRPHLVAVESIAGFAPEAFAKRPAMQNLVAVDPTQRFNLSTCGDRSTRIVDLISPIGKGTRQLIVSPPRAGKTVLLEQLVRAIRVDCPTIRAIVLLIDERPEEVTNFRRAVEGAEVIASTSDHTADEHVELTELVLAHVQTELECGKDVVLLVDSLTRIGRAFNNRTRGRGQGRPTMSGGLEAGVLEVPRRLLGLARAVENGGSVTIVATCLVDTGSKMDQMIFEEFKGTGNSELILDRHLAEARIWPAIDIPASGTRKEMRLYSPDESEAISTLRRVLSNYGPKEAMQSLFKLLDRYPTNDAFLQSMQGLAGRV